MLVTLGAAIRSRFLLRLGSAFGLASAAAMADIGRSPISPGANDNLSAVAGLLYVARRLREQPVSGVRVLLVSTGSEESFMEGMQGFGRDHFDSLPTETTDFLVLESMGSPVTVIPAGEGMLRMRDYPPEAVAMLEAAARDEGIELPRRAEDHAGHRRADPPAGGLSRGHAGLGGRAAQAAHRTTTRSRTRSTTSTGPRC